METLTKSESDWVDYMVDHVYNEVVYKAKKAQLLSISELHALGGFKYVKSMQYTWGARIKFAPDEIYLLDQAITNEVSRLELLRVCEKWGRGDYLLEDIRDLNRLHNVYFYYNDKD